MEKLLIQCKECTWIEGKDKLFVPKLDCLCEHVGHHKVLVAILGVEIKTLFFEKIMKSCILPSSKTMLQQVIHDAT